MERVTKFVEVILPVPIPNTFTYRIPAELNEEIAMGKRVVVQFGRSKHYTGLIKEIHENPPTQYKAKYIDALLDQDPIVSKDQFSFWEWMAKYYMCSIGEVMNAALPAGLKLDSEQRIILHPDYDDNFAELEDKEYLIVEAVRNQGAIKLKDVPTIVGIKTVQPIIKRLMERRVIVAEDEIKKRYKPKVQAYIKLNDKFNDERQLHLLLDKLQSNSKKSKQLNLVMGFLHLTRQNSVERVMKKELMDFANVSVSPLNSLIKSGVLFQEEFEVNRIAEYDGEETDFKQLSAAQKEAYDSINKGFLSEKPVLLHGVTSSGKTEVYVDLMRDQIEQGKQVLLMIPEIALTTQLISRLRKYFGDRIGVFHSKFSQNERVEVWQRTQSEGPDKFDILVGARSSIFLPFQDLGLIIVDEEHENTYKQYDPAPRYHARDAALYLAHHFGADILMGTATPSIESYWMVQEGKYHLVEMNKRFGDVQMPEILCADIQKEQRQKTMKSHFSSFLLKHLEDAIELKEQAIFFQNRRGYTPMWVCEDCGWVPQCTRCDVSLTYHKRAHLLNCHYCGYAIAPPKKCDACGSSKLEMKGFGTEKIEDELQILYPSLRIARMDLDTTRSKHSYQNILDSFANKEIDVLIGTQMVSKGLDFDNVSLVGVLNADQLLNFPDFRAFERAYQMMSQVAGRAGRKQKRGKVIIQTYNPDHWIVRQVIDSNYKGMYEQEIFERKNYSYPPFFRLIQFTVKHKDKDICRYCADVLTNKLKAVFMNRVLGPQDPIVGRINNYFLKQSIVKIERNLSAYKVRELITEILDDVNAQKDFKSARIIVNVDPA